MMYLSASTFVASALFLSAEGNSSPTLFSLRHRFQTAVVEPVEHRILKNGQECSVVTNSPLSAPSANASDGSDTTRRQLQVAGAVGENIALVSVVKLMVHAGAIYRVA
mmetsp:Transcript_8308/g.17092  ORF Transcript_8308/g.17092 Transcript_8308/m.17092 type:complete len:108 (+) Transcript_8308:356-679(+)